jgi:hypothetical protein
MSAQNMEPIDDFAPASPGIDEGWHRVCYAKAFTTNGQYGQQNVHILELPAIEGESIRVYTDPKMSKSSPQRLLLEAFLGREIADGEQLTPRMVKGKEAEGFVEMSERSGKPRMTKFRPSRQQPPPAAAPAAPRAIPSRPGATPPRRTDEQAAKILQLSEAGGSDLAAVNTWIAEVYPGKGLDTVSALEAAELIAQLELPF